MGFLVGCSSPSEVPEEESNGDPGPVALAYVNAFMAGDFQAAREYVLEADQGVLDVLALSQTNETTADLSVGSATIVDDRAVVILLGTMCRFDPSEMETPDCIENSDPHSELPEWSVNLVWEAAHGNWKVVFYS